MEFVFYELDMTIIYAGALLPNSVILSLCPQKSIWKNFSGQFFCVKNGKLFFFFYVKNVQNKQKCGFSIKSCRKHSRQLIHMATALMEGGYTLILTQERS